MDTIHQVISRLLTAIIYHSKLSCRSDQVKNKVSIRIQFKTVQFAPDTKTPLKPTAISFVSIVQYLYPSDQGPFLFIAYKSIIWIVYIILNSKWCKQFKFACIIFHCTVYFNVLIQQQTVILPELCIDKVQFKTTHIDYNYYRIA